MIQSKHELTPSPRKELYQSMTLDELKTTVDRDLNEARLYIDGKQETLSEHNLFKFLTYSKYNPVDVKFNYQRIIDAHRVETVDLSRVFTNEKECQKWRRAARPKKCYHNAYLLSWDLYWDYCEGFFIDGQFCNAVDHAWNKTPDGLYVDITGERLQFADKGVYVCYYETSHVRLRELQKLGGKRLGIYQISQIDWFSKYDPGRLKPGKIIIDLSQKRKPEDREHQS